jgi:hypothetical protein
MSAPSSNRRERRPAEPTLSRTLTNDAKAAASITDVGNGVVADLRGSDLRLDRATEAAVSVTGPAGPAELLDEWLHHQ